MILLLRRLVLRLYDPTPGVLVEVFANIEREALLNNIFWHFFLILNWLYDAGPGWLFFFIMPPIALNSLLTEYFGLSGSTLACKVSYLFGPGPSWMNKVDFLVRVNILLVPLNGFGVMLFVLSLLRGSIWHGPGDSSIFLLFLLEGKENLGVFFFMKLYFGV